MRWTTARAKLLGAALSGLAAAGCDSATGGSPQITLSLSVSSAQVSQGGNATLTLNVQRSNFSNAVNLAVDGLPSGVTAAFTPAFLSGSEEASTLLLAATGAAEPGTVTLTVRAFGEGLTQQTAPVELTVGVTGAFTLAPFTPAVTVAQGGAGSATILINRTGGNASVVSLSVAGAPSGGAPSGVAAALSPSGTSERGVSLSLTAASSVAPGTYPITIDGTSPGFEPQSTTLSLVVIPPPSTATLTVPFCQDDVPTWFAYQNEGYGWQRVLPTGAGNEFTFQATDRLGVAFVFQDPNGITTNVYYATRVDIADNSDTECAGPNSVTGTVGGLAAGQTVRVQMGADDAVVEAGVTDYTLNAVPERTLDLVATLGRSEASQIAFTSERVIIRRALNQGNNSTIATLDFGTDGFAVDSASFALLGVEPGEELYFQSFLWTATTTFGLIQTSEPGVGGSGKLYFVPAPQLAAGDLHEVYFDARRPTSTSLIGHSYIAYSAAPENRSDALGPVVSTPVLSMVSSTPHVRMRAQLPSQSEYGSSVRFAFQQGGGFRTIIIGVSAAYLGAAPATWDAVFPDLTGASGFDDAWMLSPQTSTIYQVEAFSGRASLLFGAQPIEGDFVRTAYQLGYTGTALRSPDSASATTAGRPGVRRGARPLPQYFRR